MKILIEWVGSITLIVALVTLLIMYFRGTFRPRLKFPVKNLPSPAADNFAFTVANLSDSFITQGKATGFWVGADNINVARLEAIRSAKSSIKFETYTMSPGRRANDFAEAIAQQALAGVRVQLIADNFGAKSIPQKYWQRLRAAGVDVRIFNRFTWRYPLEHLKRNHRKLLLIDQQVALIGGAGVSDDWDGLEKIGDTAPWLDYEVCFQGPVVARLTGIFLQHWLDAGGTADFSEEALNPSQSNEPTVLVTSGEDPTYRDSAIRALYQSLIRAAKKRVWIASPYFLPNTNTREILVSAKRQGIDVRILTMGQHSDKRFIHYTSRELYDNLLTGGIEIYEHQPSMMHAKIMLIDDNWFSLGSANFDPRSFFHNDELNLSTSDEHLSQQIERFFLEAFARSYCVSRRDWQRRKLWERLIGRFWLLFYWHL